MRFWGIVSAALHVFVLALLLLELSNRRFEEPAEQAFSVEVVSQLPPQQAQGERPAPVAAPPDPVPPPPTPTPPQPEAPRVTAPEAPPPPPPPPPPAPAPPPQQAQPLPTPPLPTPPPAITPEPAPRAPQQQQQAQPRPEPPLPVPPPPVPPPPEPAQQAGTSRTPPPQRPQERSQSVQNTLERLRAQQQQQEPPRARPNPAPATPQQGGGAPTGSAPLTAAERTGLADRIGECWKVDAGALNVREITVELRVDVDPGGVVRAVRPNGSAPTDPRSRMVYEAARRALLDPACNPLPLPRERLSALRDTIFRFNPRDLGLR